MTGVLIILYSILYFVLARIHFKWAIMLMLAALPSYLIRFKIFGAPTTLLEIMIFISFGVWLSNNYRQIFKNLKLRIKFCKPQAANLKLIRYPFDIEIIALLIISFVSIGIAGFSNDAFGAWKAYFFEPVLIYILILNVFKQGGEKKLSFPKILRKLNFFIIAPLAISAFTLSAFAIYQKFTGAFIANEFWAAQATRRITSFFEYPNAVGLYLGPIIMLMIGWLLYVILSGAKRREEFQKNCKIAKSTKPFIAFRFIQNDIRLILFIAVTIVLSIFSIYFAKSEGALIAVVAGFIIFGLLFSPKSRWTAVCLIAIIGLTVFFSQPIKERVVQKITLSDLSGEIRKQQWRETWQMLTSGPAKFIFGSGLANYQKEIHSYHQEGIFFNKDNDPDFRRKIVIFDDKYRVERWHPVEIYLYPHNIFLNFWTELGLAGMLLFVWMIFKFFRISFKLLKNYESRAVRSIILGLTGSMAVIVVHGLVDVPYFKNDLAIIFWILLAMISVINLNYILRND